MNFIYLLNSFQRTIFFKLFRVNFDSECSVWTQNAICKFEACQVCQCEEHEIPLPWQQESIYDELNKNIKENFYRLFEKYNYSSSQWLVENEIDSKNGIYVDLLKNPEGYTGYQGQQIWTSIYKENCFSVLEKNMCSEEKVFFKIISGIHSNINLQICKSFLNLEKNITYSNIELMKKTFLNHQDRINNLFFLHSLLVNALFKGEKFISDYDFNTGYTKDDFKIKEILSQIFNEKEMRDFHKKGFENSINLKKFFKYEKLNEIKMRFRNISEIINCVSCQKCRLHGKLQIYGVATMLKILFNEEKSINLKRNEIVSFINMIDKVSTSIKYVTDYLDKLSEEYIREQNYYISLTSLIILLILFMLIYFINNKKI